MIKFKNAAPYGVFVYPTNTEYPRKIVHVNINHMYPKMKKTMQNKEITPLEEFEELIETLTKDKDGYFDSTEDAKKYDHIKNALKVLEIIKENCSIYTESLFPLGDAHWWNVHLRMRGYIADKKEKEQFDLLKEVLLK